LSLLSREIKVWKDDPILKKGYARHPKRDMQPALEKLARHVGNGILQCSALRAHVNEHFAQMLWVVEKEFVH
jgi:hypothetical protein